MFELIVELDSEQLKLGIHKYIYGDITIVGQYGSVSSKQYKTVKSSMLFISITELLDGVRSLVLNNEKQYDYLSIGSGFTFHIIRKKNHFIITDVQNKLIAKSTSKELIQSIWNPVNKFITKYRPYLEEGAGVTIGLDDSVKDFQTQLAEYL